MSDFNNDFDSEMSELSQVGNVDKQNQPQANVYTAKYYYGISLRLEGLVAPVGLRSFSSAAAPVVISVGDSIVNDFAEVILLAKSVRLQNK